MNLPDFSSGYWPLVITLGMLLVIVGRYFLVAGLFYLIFYIWAPGKWESRKLSQKTYPSGQLKREISWSLVTSLIFALAATGTLILWQKGLTRIYTIPDQYGWGYLPISLLLAMLLHETFYYWLHRWMHRPAVFRLVHKVHHDSHIASPFTAFSFHPLEGLLQAVFLPAILMVLPLYYWIIIIQLTLMTFSSVINHLNIEIYPRDSYKYTGRWIIGATHHSLHHKQFKYNFGLYFTFWDKIEKTQSPGFREVFGESTKRASGRKKLKI